MLVQMTNEWVARPNRIDALATHWQRFSQWWLRGLRETAPTGWLPWIHGQSIPRLMIRRDRDQVICRLVATDLSKEMRTSPHGFGLPALNAWLSECNLRLNQVSVGVAVDRERFFTRSVSLPVAAAAALPKILEQDLLRRTPFQLADVWHGATPDGPAGSDVLTMCHWIIRKDHAELAVTELGLHSNEVDYIAANDPDGNYAPVIWYRKAAHEDPAWARQAIKMMSVAVLGTALLGLAAFECAQFSIATAVATSLSEARELARGSGNRGDFNHKAVLFAMKSDVSVLEIWNELSRILPDHTFLTESRIADGKVTISGFSSDAARLVRLIDQSPLFTGANLAAGITPDATEHKDRFSIGFKVRNTQTLPSFSSAAKDQG
jgi:general secretion pathway protein L